MFIAPSADHVPPILVHFVGRCRSLHRNVILLTVRTETIAHVPAGERYQITDLGDGFWRLVLHFGYMELRVWARRSAPSSSVSIFRWTSKTLLTM